MANHQQMTKHHRNMPKIEQGEGFSQIRRKKLEGKDKSSTDDEKHHVNMPQIKQGEGFLKERIIFLNNVSLDAFGLNKSLD